MRLCLEIESTDVFRPGSLNLVTVVLTSPGEDTWGAKLPEVRAEMGGRV